MTVAPSLDSTWQVARPIPEPAPKNYNKFLKPILFVDCKLNVGTEIYFTVILIKVFNTTF